MKVHTVTPFGYKMIPNGYESGWREEYYDSVPSSDEFSKVELYENLKTCFEELVQNISAEGISTNEFILPHVLLRKEELTRNILTKTKIGVIPTEEILYKIKTYYCSQDIKLFAIEKLNNLAIKNNYYVEINYDEDCYDNIDETKNIDKQPHSLNITLYNEKSYLKLFQTELLAFKNYYEQTMFNYQKGYLNITYSSVIEELSNKLRSIKNKFNSLINADTILEDHGFKLDDRGKILVFKKY